MKRYISVIFLLVLLVSRVGATGLQLMYTTQANGQDDLYVIGIDTEQVRRATNHRAKDSHGVPSPDGRRIVFNSERVGWWKIWVADADGTHTSQLTAPTSGADYYPDWSPDGKKIVYATNTIGNGDIVVMNADGSSARNISSHPAQDNFPAWSPNGRWIAYASDRDGSWAIHVTDPAGGNTRRITGTGNAIEPSWYPDSRQIIYQSDNGGSVDLYSVMLDGTQAPKRLTASKGDEKRPAVSPDGKWIAFESNREGGSHIFIKSTDGTEVRRLTHQGYNYGPRWMPLLD